MEAKDIGGAVQDARTPKKCSFKNWGAPQSVRQPSTAGAK